MNRKTISQPYHNYYYYICSTFKKQHSGACTKHTIRSDRLEQAVLETLRSQIALAVEMDELIARSTAVARAAVPQTICRPSGHSLQPSVNASNR